MTALDLGSAAHTLVIPSAPSATEFTFGDETFVPTTSPHDLSTYGGWSVIPRDTSDGATELMTATFAPSDNWFFVVVLHGANSMSDFPIAYSDWLTMVVGAEGVSIVSTAGVTVASGTSLTPMGAGATVLAVACNGTESFFATSDDGVVSTATGATGATVDNLTLGATPDAAGAGILGAWLWEGLTVSQADALDTVAAISLDFSAPATELVATGSWRITGSAILTAGEVDVDPEIVTPPKGGSVTPPAVPTYTVPSGAVAPYLLHVWEDMPLPSLDGRKWPIDWEPDYSDGIEYARPQTVVEGVDVSFLNGIPIPVPSYSRVEPFGSQAAQIVLPQLHAFAAMPSWAKPGANVDIRLIKKAGGYKTVFSGLVRELARQEDTGLFSLECDGVMFAADLQLVPPSFSTAPQDSGHRIASVLNNVVGRRYSKVSSVVTGCPTSVAGGWAPVLTGTVQPLLATCLTGGRQWTVKCAVRQPVIAKKDTTTNSFTVRTGQRGIDIDLSKDASSAVNVILGEGTNASRGHWRNAKYPNWKPDDTPPYPNTNPAQTMRVGARDSGTDSGSGVSEFQRKLGLPVDRAYSQADRTVVKREQKRAGITVDGIVGPQSWAAFFDTGANTGTLDGAFIAPLAAVHEVMPRLYGPDGDDLGANPSFDPDVIRVEEKRDYGQGISRAEGANAAREEVARTSVPAWQGTITFTLDPESMSRFELMEGMNGTVLDWQGDDVFLHVAAVDANPEGGTVTLTVDERARDYPTLEAIRERDRNATDPAKVATKRLLTGTVASDRPVYDAESPAGRMPRHAIFTNLWDVRRIPMGDAGAISRTVFTTTGSPQPFSLAVFGKSLTAADLQSAIGNPLTSENNPWEDSDLDDLGLLQSWGWKEQRAGFYPKTDSNPTGKTSAPVTGRLVDDASWGYASESSPWLWVAAIASAACYIEGRFYGSTS